MLDRIPDGLPSVLDYRTYVEHGSRYNTPPVFAIYIVMLITRWLRDEVGGLDEMHARDREKANLLYDILDAAPMFYRGHARADSRSLMNVTFRLPSEISRQGSSPRQQSGVSWSSRVTAASAGSEPPSTTRCRAKGSKRSPPSCASSTKARAMTGTEERPTTT